jgi:hypothetical protein
MYLHSIKSTDSRLDAARYFFPKSEPVIRYRFYHGRMSEVIDIDKRRSVGMDGDIICRDDDCRVMIHSIDRVIVRINDTIETAPIDPPHELRYIVDRDPDDIWHFHADTGYTVAFRDDNANSGHS